MVKSSKNAFTIIELLVAMALLVMMLSLSGLVFNTTVKTYRAAEATVDVSRHLTAVTSQITADLSGLRQDAPLFIRFDYREDENKRRYDAIHFFADGDFQTTREYLVYPDSGNDGFETIYGTLARIYYGHANSVDLLNSPADQPDFNAFQVLARKAHILTAYDALAFTFGEIPGCVINPFADTFGVTTYQVETDAVRTYRHENGWEFNTITLDNWINTLNISANADHFIKECMSDDCRPYVSLSDEETLHLLLAQGVLKFSIQWAYSPEDLDGPVTGFAGGIRWWPSRDPNRDGNENDSDFDSQGIDRSVFGVYLNLPEATETDWLAVRDCRTGGRTFKSTFYPEALKFTFVLRDGNGFFEDGKTFSHIVYLK